MSIDSKPMAKRIAIFWNVKCSFESTFAQHEGDERGDEWTIDGYVRRSEWMDVEFKPLTNGEMAEAALAAIAIERAQVVREFTHKLAQIDEQAANFRALNAPVTP